MSQPKEYFYTYVKKWIMIKDKLPADRVQTVHLQKAFDEALEETSQLTNGDLRIKAIKEILIDKTRTYEGVAQEVNYDWRTVQNWITAFVNLVGQKAGF